ncbi:hypothetical protein ACS0TY_012520 [Phlomoides rotata]
MLEESASAIPSSVWASLISWFTPTVFFVLLNLMIGTIFFTSSISNKKQPQKQSQSDLHHPLARSPSVLQRLKSVNFYAHLRSQEPPQDSSQYQKQIPDSDADNAFQSQEHYFFQHNSHQESSGETVHLQSQTQTQTQTHYAYEHNLLESETRFDLEEKESSVDEFQIEESEQSMDEVYSQLSGNHVSRTKSDTKPSAGEIPAKLPKKMKKSATMKSTFNHFEEEDIVEARRPATVKEKGSSKATDPDEGVDAKADDFINRFKQQLKLQRLDSIIRYKDMIGRSG